MDVIPARRMVSILLVLRRRFLPTAFFRHERKVEKEDFYATLEATLDAYSILDTRGSHGQAS